MPVLLNPYIGFRDTARQALEFYQSVFGGELVISTFGDFQASEDPAEQDKVMHGMLHGADGIVLMCSDTPNGMDVVPASNISVSLSGDDESLLREYWVKLSGSGEQSLPLERAPWGDYFGMCVDGFGVTWIVNITEPAEA